MTGEKVLDDGCVSFRVVDVGSAVDAMIDEVGFQRDVVCVGLSDKLVGVRYGNELITRGMN